MAIYYVDSTAGSNTSPYDTWAKAATDIATVDSLAGAGDFVYVHKAHSQTQATTLTLDFTGGTVASPVKILVVDKDASDALSTMASSTGKIEATGNSQINWNGTCFVYGIKLVAKAFDFGPATGEWQIIDTCLLEKTSTTFGQVVYFGASQVDDSWIKVINCTLDFSLGNSAGANVQVQGVCVIRGGSYTCHTAQTHLFDMSLARGGSQLEVTDMDLSGAAPTTAVLKEGEGRGTSFRRCKLPTGTPLVSGGTFRIPGDGRVICEQCKIGTISAPVIDLEYHEYLGTVKSDSARYRTGGASDSETSYSWAMTTNANAVELYSALESPPMTVWTDDDSGGAVTLTVYVASGATLNNDDFWIEVSSPDETASPNQTAQGNWQTTRAAPLATPAALTTDASSTWNGTGVGTKQEIAVTLNPTEPGPVTIRCFLAKPSTTVYVDPYLELT